MGRTWVGKEVGRAATGQPTGKGLEVGRLSGLQFVLKREENESGKGPNRNALKSLSLKLMQLTQVRQHCRIWRLVSAAMGSVDWRENCLEIDGN